jgi:16S rRNA (adenine1518-N6/adenine1519-N6)-dimethyltransferase
MKAKKSLGQNFLNSKSALKSIIDTSDLNSKDIILEVGPGKGVLTEELLKIAEKVLVVEKDHRLIPFLEEKFQKEIREENLVLIEKDILDFDLNTLPNDYKVIANIPYYITGQILRMILGVENQPKLITLLVQKEVAERIVAKDGKESLLSLSVKAFGDPKLVTKVPRGAFSPAPNVDSAILNIKNISKDRLGNISEAVFFEILHLGFAHKRKQLLANLSQKYSREKILEIFSKLNLSLQIRAEDIDLKTWIELCKKMAMIQLK